MGKILGNELLPKIIDLINAERLAVIVATVDENNNPNSTPIGFVKATSPSTLRLAFHKSQSSHKNILNSSKISVSFFAEENISVKMEGEAKLIKELEDYFIFEMKINEIKSSRSPYVRVVHGIDYEPMNKEAADYLDTILAELIK
ncbi:MAG: pyridoxamine 5'-phosphate oxidase family protein [archaeon]|nr:pyridoxamine 5'-phosphate oxidase family protein [archaeon]